MKVDVRCEPNGIKLFVSRFALWQNKVVHLNADKKTNLCRCETNGTKLFLSRFDSWHNKLVRLNADKKITYVNVKQMLQNFSCQDLTSGMIS